MRLLGSMWRSVGTANGRLCLKSIGFAAKYNQLTMKAHVYVTLKRTVLDAQGQTVAGALRRMNFQGVSDIRQGKYFVLTLDDAFAADSRKAQAEVERIAREVLTNPVIEEFSFRIEA